MILLESEATTTDPIVGVADLFHSCVLELEPRSLERWVISPWPPVTNMHPFILNHPYTYST